MVLNIHGWADVADELVELREATEATPDGKLELNMQEIEKKFEDQVKIDLNRQNSVGKFLSETEIFYSLIHKPV